MLRTRILTTSKVIFDYETRSYCDLKVTGAWPYSEHETTEILCLGALISGEHQIVLWLPHAFGLGDDAIANINSKYDLYIGKEIPPPLEAALDLGYIFEAHNAEFDYAIWKNICKARYSWPELKISQVSDSMARLSRNGLPSGLSKAGEVQGLSIVKDPIGESLITQMCKPHKKPKKEIWNYIYTEEKHVSLIDYCAQDLRATAAVVEDTYPMNASEQEIWEDTTRINERGFPVDIPSIKVIQTMEGAFREKLIQKLEKDTEGEITVGDMKKVAMIKEWVNNEGVECDSVDADNVTRMLALDLPEKVQTVLLARQQLGTSATSKFTSMQNMTTERCKRVRGGFQYYGATKTGRWAGRKVQPHNMARPTLKQDSIDDIYEMIEDCRSLDDILDYIDDHKVGNAKCLSSLVRGAIKAPRGKTFMVADYAAIEARGVFWLSEEDSGIDAFAESDAGNGPEIYKIMAGDIFGIKAEDVDGDQRKVGKQAILGCGYGMGPNMFKITCDGYGIDLPPFSEDDLEAMKSKSSEQYIVKSYKAKYPEVPKTWKGLEKAAIRAVDDMYSVKHYGCVGFKCVEKKGRKALVCILPSRRMLVYQEPRTMLTKTPWGSPARKLFFKGMVTKKGGSGGYHWAEAGIWGGTWMENVCQAICRDLLAHSIKQARLHGYDSIMHVHDELVVEVPDSYGESELNEFYRVVEMRPDWAKTFPVKASGYVSNRYMKD